MFEGGLKLDLGLQVVRRQMVRSTHAGYLNIKSGVLENFTVVCGKNLYILYSRYIIRVGKRTHTKAHSAVGEEHKKYKCKEKNPP